MAMVVHRNIKQDYINALNETCDDIKEQSENILGDIEEKPIRKIEIVINIEANNIVEYEVKKTYFTGKVE